MNMPPSKSIVLARDGSGIAHVVFDRPEAMNAIDVTTARRFRQICEELASDRGLRVVVLRGNGRCFGSGGDVASMRDDPEPVIDELIGEMNVAMGLLGQLDAPVVASLHGVVAGGSLSLSLGCDLAIAAEGTRFNLAYSNLGTCCDLSGTWSLPRIVGLRKALELALLSEPFDAAEALRLGIVNLVVRADALEAETLALAQRLASGATRAYGQIRRLMRASFETPLADQLHAEREAFKACTRTEDFQGGVAAFLDKRKPLFTGR
jgi:2-(1,2-epoxy-1,2-dihydrophenyl)acetyl-CoA isomerase